MEKHIVCISCPAGCRLTVSENENAEVIVSGNLCHRGEVYGREEFSNPKRIVTAIVKTSSALVPYAPVKTDRPLERDRIPGLLEILYRMKAVIPITRGDAIIEKYAGTEVNVVFTRSVGE
jgi:CxxC motif-containing protein